MKSRRKSQLPPDVWAHEEISFLCLTVGTAGSSRTSAFKAVKHIPFQAWRAGGQSTSGLRPNFRGAVAELSFRAGFQHLGELLENSGQIV